MTARDHDGEGRARRDRPEDRAAAVDRHLGCGAHDAAWGGGGHRCPPGGPVVVALCLVALAVLVVVLFVAGVHKNAQINRLRHHGVAVTVTVSGCLGLFGGSGSNPAGYACQGTFTLDGHRYSEDIPGNVLRLRGRRSEPWPCPATPRSCRRAHAVATERASASVFVVPAILLGAGRARALPWSRRRGSPELRSTSPSPPKTTFCSHRPTSQRRRAARRRDGRATLSRCPAVAMTTTWAAPRPD